MSFSAVQPVFQTAPPELKRVHAGLLEKYPAELPLMNISAEGCDLPHLKIRFNKQLLCPLHAHGAHEMRNGLPVYLFEILLQR